MKRQLLFLMVSIFVTSCVKDLDFIAEESPAKYSTEEARNYFEEYIASLPELSSRAYDNNSIFGIDISPLWEQSIVNGENSLASVDVPINENRKLVARVDENSYFIPCVQKLIVVKETVELGESAYLLTLIPDIDDLSSIFLEPNDFLNLGEKNNFSGLAIYSFPLTERVARVDRYKNGIKTEAYGMFGTHEENHSALKCINNILQNITFRITVSVQTRSTIEGGTLPPVTVTPTYCSWCGSASCNGWCWTGGGGGGTTPPTNPNPGGGTGGGGGGGGTNPPPTNPVEPENPDYSEQEQKLSQVLLDFVSKLNESDLAIFRQIFSNPNFSLEVRDFNGNLQTPAVFWTTNDDGSLKVVIAFPPNFVSNVTDVGLNQTFCHEMWHVYLNYNVSNISQINETSDHSSMITNPVYERWLRTMIPGKDGNYYDIIKYVGAENTPEYKALPEDKKNAIQEWRKTNNF